MKTLRSKILTWFILSLTITLSLLLYLVNSQIKNVNIPLTENLSQQIINAKGNEIGTWLYQRISELRVISSNEDFMNMNMEKIKPYIQTLNKSLNCEYGNEYETFAITNLNGESWIDDYTTIDIKNREYFIEAINSDKEFIISNPIVSKTDSAPIVVIIYPIHDKMGKKVGFIHGAMNLSKLSQIASDITLHDGVAWIMDSSGNIFTTLPSNQENKLNEFTELITEKANQINILEMYKYGYQGLEDVGEKMLNGHSGTDAIKKADGTQHILIYAPIPYADGWALGIIISEKELHKDTNRLIHLIIIFGIILFAIVIEISLIYTSSIIKPINKLQQLMKEVENGNLEIHYSSKGSDEITQLGNSFNSMIIKIQNLIDKVYLEQKSKRKAELKALQSQIKPHFLYNTLDTIQWKAIEHGAYDAADMIMALSNLFRTSISKGNEIITIEEEIEHTKNYLYIQKIRYQETLDYTIDYDKSLTDFKILKLIIQPIVENSIYHGLKNRREKGLIEITITKQDDSIIICVKDNGVGMTTQHLEKIRHHIKTSNKDYESTGYGLFNVYERIQLEFGSSYGIIIDSVYNIGTEVKLKIPMIKEGASIC